MWVAKSSKYKFLGNFDLSNFFLTIDNKVINFTSIESAYQAQKFPHVAHNFSMLSPNESRVYANFLVKSQPIDGWENTALYAMANAMHAKFSNDTLFQMLCDVPEEIVIGNVYHDNFWGQCLCEKCLEKHIRGLNLMGKMYEHMRQNNNNLQMLYKYIETDLLPIALSTENEEARKHI